MYIIKLYLECVMRCFIHTNIEAIAACRQCGKGMCENCSAYSGHTGICPECRRNEFIAEVNTKQARVEELDSKIIWNIVKTVLLCWTIVFLFVGIYRHCKMKDEIAELKARIEKLNAEITRLSRFIQTHGKEFV